MSRIPPKEDPALPISQRPHPLQPDPPINQLMLGNPPRNSLRKRISRNRLIPRPRRNLAQENLESLQINPRLQLARRILRATRRRRWNGRMFALGFRLVGCCRAHVVRIRDDGCKEFIIDHGELIMGEATDSLEVPNGCALGKVFNLIGNDGTETTSFGKDRFVGDDVEFSESNDQQFLEVGNGADSRIRMRGMGRFADCGKVVSHRVDEHSVVGNFQQFFGVDLKDRYIKISVSDWLQVSRPTQSDLE
jgi:hypothetical protein